jgi:hypothetical protein
LWSKGGGKLSQCTLGASLSPFIVVTKLTALDPLLTTQITKMLPSGTTGRTTAMLRKELTALIALLLITASLKGRIDAHSHLLFFFYATV